MKRSVPITVNVFSKRPGVGSLLGLHDYPDVFHEDLRSLARRLRDPGVGCVQWDQPIGDAAIETINRVLRDRPQISVRIYSATDVRQPNLRQLALLSNCRRFTLDHTGVRSLEPLRALSPKLNALGLGQTYPYKMDLAVLDHFRSLKSVWINGHSRGLGAIRRHTDLRRVSLRSITLPNLDLLTPLQELNHLSIALGGTRDLRGIERLAQLRALSLTMVRGLADLRPIESVPSLRFLELRDLKHVRSLPDPRRLPELRGLWLERMSGIRDLTPLRRAKNLASLTVTLAMHMQPADFVCLRAHPSLRRFSAGLGADYKQMALDAMFNLPSARLLMP